MERGEALAFLKRHQPMPNDPPEVLLSQYKATTAYFHQYPEEACIPLYLKSFGDWDDFTVYESVQSVLRKFPPEMVIPHLKRGMAAKEPPIRLWCADTVRFFPSEILLEELADLMEEESEIFRLIAAISLEKVGTERAKKIAQEKLATETDPGVCQILRDVLESD